MKTSNDRKFLKLDKETVVPMVNDDIEWTLRYGSEEDIIKQRLYLASIVSYYEYLLGTTNQRRNYVANQIKKYKVEEKD